MVGGPARPEGKLVVIYIDGIGAPVPGPGAWGAVLTYGEHTRELYDFESETTGNRMQLLAAVRALECLTRPVSVQVWIDSEYVSRGVTEWQRDAWVISEKRPDRNVDLWLRLAAASERHEVAWSSVGENFSSPGYLRAAELAIKELADAVAQSLDDEPDAPRGRYVSGLVMKSRALRKCTRGRGRRKAL